MELSWLLDASSSTSRLYFVHRFCRAVYALAFRCGATRQRLGGEGIDGKATVLEVY